MLAKNIRDLYIVKRTEFPPARE